MKLSELKTGEKAVIVKVSGHGGFRKRIIEMVKVIMQSTPEKRDIPPELCKITLECELMIRNTTANKK